MSNPTLEVLRFNSCGIEGMSRSKTSQLEVEAVPACSGDYLGSTHLTPDICEAKELRLLEFVVKETSPPVFDQLLRRIPTMFPSSIQGPSDIMITVCQTGYNWPLAEKRIYPFIPVIMHDCREFEEALLNFSSPPRLTLSMPHAKWNRLLFWSKIYQDQFPRLHKRGLLQVRVCGEYNMFELFNLNGLHIYQTIRDSCLAMTWLSRPLRSRPTVDI